MLSLEHNKILMYFGMGFAGVPRSHGAQVPASIRHQNLSSQVSLYMWVDGYHHMIYSGINSSEVDSTVNPGHCMLFRELRRLQQYQAMQQELKMSRIVCLLVKIGIHAVHQDR